MPHTNKSIILKYIFLSVILFILVPESVNAQAMQDFGDRYIRVAEIGQLADSINVWGDVSSAGRYLVPEGTNLPDLISFCFGFQQRQGGGGRANDFSKTMIEVKVSRDNKKDKLVKVAFFRYKYHDPEPPEMFEFNLQNNDLVTLQVRRRPSFTDYVNVVAPVVGVIATSFLLIQNLRGK